MENEIKKYFLQGIEERKNLICDGKLLSNIALLCEMVSDAMLRGNKIMLAGNGGSAADSQHIAAEFISRFKFDRPSLPAIALTTDTSALTAIGNDYGFEQLFSRQISGLGVKGDIFIGITTSGRSENIHNALALAREMEIATVVLTGANSIKFDDKTLCIRVPSLETCFIQEMHISVGHFMCQNIEEKIFA